MLPRRAATFAAGAFVGAGAIAALLLGPDTIPGSKEVTKRLSEKLQYHKYMTSLPKRVFFVRIGKTHGYAHTSTEYEQKFTKFVPEHQVRQHPGRRRVCELRKELSRNRTTPHRLRLRSPSACSDRGGLQ